LAHDLRTHSGALTRGDLHVGQAAARLTGSYAGQSETTILRLKFAGSNMPSAELAELLPPMGMALPSGSSLQGGTANVSFTVEGPVDKLTTRGSAALKNTVLSGFDLGTKMSIVETLAGIKRGPNTNIENFSTDLKMTQEGISVDNLQLLASDIGEMSGSGTISPANALDFKMRATVHSAGLAAALSRTAIPFRIEGTAENPVFRPDMKAVVSDQTKDIKQNLGKTAGGLLNNLLGGKKKQ
jgi:AsmA protein